MPAFDPRGGRRIFWTIEYDAEGVAIIADDLKGLRDRCIWLMHWCFVSDSPEAPSKRRPREGQHRGRFHEQIEQVRL
jgi:hypothetical protein